MLTSIKSLWVPGAPSSVDDALDRVHDEKKTLLVALRQCHEDIEAVARERQALDARLSARRRTQRDLEAKLKEILKREQTACQRFIESRDTCMIVPVTLPSAPPVATALVVGAEEEEPDGTGAPDLGSNAL